MIMSVFIGAPESESVGLHSKFHQVSSKCQSSPTGSPHLEFQGAQLRKRRICIFPTINMDIMKIFIRGGIQKFDE